MTRSALLLSAAALVPMAPALAVDAAATPSRVARAAANPTVLGSSERAHYREVFAALSSRADLVMAAVLASAIGGRPRHKPWPRAA